MAAPGGRGEVRVKLMFEYPPPALPHTRHLWFLLDTELCRAVTDVSAIIRERFFYSRRGSLSLYLDGSLLPPGESARLIRDNDSISVTWEAHTGHDSPHRTANKRQRPEDGAPEGKRGVHRGPPEERREKLSPEEEVSERPKKKKKMTPVEEVSERPKKKEVTSEEEVSGRPKKKKKMTPVEEVSERPKKKKKKKKVTQEQEEVSERPKKVTQEQEEVSERPKKKVTQEEVSERPKKVTQEQEEVSKRPKKKVTQEQEEVSERPKKKVTQEVVSERPKKKVTQEQEEVSEWPKKVTPDEEELVSTVQEKAPPPVSTTRKGSSSSSDQEDTGAPLSSERRAAPSSPDTFIIKKSLLSGQAVSPPVYNGCVARGGGQHRPPLRTAECGVGRGRGIDHPPLRGWGFRGQGQAQPQNHYFYNYSPETIKRQHLNEDVSNVSVLMQNPPAAPIKDYSALPLLAAPPQPGKVIAFKLLELTENYTPEVSDYKEGRILSYDPISQQLEVEVLSQQKRKEPGKFDLVYEGEDGMDVVEYAVPQDCKITQAWTSLIEPRLVTEHGP